MARPAGEAQPGALGDPEIATSSAAPVRPASPPEFRRITRMYKRRRNETVTFAGSNNIPSFQFAGGGEGRGTNLDELAWLIANLKETITQQNNIIENIRAEVSEIKNQNADLQEEVRSLKTQLDTHSASAPSWASVAAGGFNSEPGPSTRRSRTTTITTSTIPTKEPNCIRISTQPKQDNAEASGSTEGVHSTFTRYLPTTAANTHIRNALANAEATKRVQIAGIATTKTGYVIRFKDQQSMETARTNTEWLKRLGNGTKLAKPRFGVVVHRTPTENIEIQDDKQGSINKIMEENDLAQRNYQIEDIAWLKCKDKPLGQHSSLGIWFDSAEAAEWTINNGLVFEQRYIGSIVPYQMKEKRCYRCQRVGHLAWACREPPRCGYCAGNHERQQCPPGIAAKCIDCEGPHPTGSRECKRFNAQDT
jgi:hypothetical protein